MVSLRSSSSFLFVILFLQHSNTVRAFRLEPGTSRKTQLEVNWRLAKESRGELRNFQHDAALDSFGDYPWPGPGIRLRRRSNPDFVGEQLGNGTLFSKEGDSIQLDQVPTFGNDLDDGWAFFPLYLELFSRNTHQILF